MLQKQADITFVELFRQADLALYSAKKAGKGQAAFLSYQRGANGGKPLTVAPIKNHKRKKFPPAAAGGIL